MTAGPLAVLISGAPATGKSTLAGALAGRLGAALLDLDTATGPLTAVIAGLIGRADLSDPELAARTRRPRYDTLFDLAADTLRTGTPVVLVAPFTAERTAEGWARATARLPGRAVLIWLHLDPDELLRRMTERSAGRDSAKTADPASFLATVHTAPPAAPHLAVDAALPKDRIVHQVMWHIGALAIDGTP